MTNIMVKILRFASITVTTRAILYVLVWKEDLAMFDFNFGFSMPKRVHCQLDKSVSQECGASTVKFEVIAFLSLENVP